MIITRRPLENRRLGRVIGWVLWLGVMGSSACLTAGLLMMLARGDTAAARGLLAAGVILLMATPPARVVVSMIEYTLEREWLFVALTLVVLAELVVSLLAAIGASRR